GFGLISAPSALAWLTAPGKQGPCGASDLLPIPSAGALKKPVPTHAPVKVAPAVVTATPEPTPLPPGPHIFVDDEQALAGAPIEVSGWYLAKNASYTISLDGERTLGSVRTDDNGAFTSSLIVPDTVT